MRVIRSFITYPLVKIDTAIFSSAAEGMIGMDASLLKMCNEGIITPEDAVMHSASAELMRKKLRI